MRTSFRQHDHAATHSDAAPAKAAKTPERDPTVKAADPGLIVVIEKRALIRDCLARCLERGTGQPVLALASVREWSEKSRDVKASLFLVCQSGTDESAADAGELDRFLREVKNYPTIVLADTDSVEHICAAIDKGARGYISTNLTLDVAIEAMRLVNAGGTFVPASSLFAARQTARSAPADTPPNVKGIFTDRQAAIVDALRRGKANKVIAYELQMRESTVKVHVRNIMKKLNAKNRTEVAYIASEMLASAGPLLR